LAGTRCAIAHVGHHPTRAALDRAPLDFFGTPSVLSRVATVAAWRDGDDWLRAAQAVLDQNRRRISEWAAGHPELRYHAPEATYLSWLDFSGSGLAGDPAGELLRSARVQLSPGADFAQHTAIDTSSFARLNFATTPAMLDEILDRIDGSHMH
ncbi:MAG: aminotransferase, class, partial [Mycobacterium sp.]|nr:aminotransferase, class [Mycobacterium sp.]